MVPPMTQTEPSQPPTETRSKSPAGSTETKAYWRTNLTYLAVLLTIWASVSLGAGILFVEPLNKFKIGSAPLGFWFAQQGSIYVFVILIAVYVVLMNKLDRRFGVRED